METIPVTKIKKGMIMETPNGCQVIKSCNPGNGEFHRLTFENSNDVCLCPNWKTIEVITAEAAEH